MSLRQQIIMAHYNQYWGLATEVLRYAFSDDPQDAPFVAEFAIGTDDEPLYVYATIGMSGAPMSNGERAELFLYASQPSDEIRQSLALLAVYPFHQQLALAPLDTIYGSHGLVEGSSLTSVLLTLPTREPEEFAVIDTGDDQVQMLMVTPISEHERQLCIEQGPLALIELFARQQVDLADLWRAGVKGGNPS